MRLLACKVGTCCASLSSLSICKRVVLPALSNPKNNSLPDFFHNPEIKENTNTYTYIKTWLLMLF